jgi:hypothetical protein
MKSINFFVFSFFISLCSFSQDTIYFKNAGKQIAIVKEVSQTDIQYKKIELPDGPMYILSKNDIEKIVYKNGYTEIIKPEVIEVSIQNTVSSDQPVVVSYQKITYADAKSRNGVIYGMITRHPDQNRQIDLRKIHRSMRGLKAGQDATRTVSIVFGGITLGSLALVGLANLIDSSTGGFEIPVAFGSVAVLTCAASITFHVNLRKKRNEFVKVYND